MPYSPAHKASTRERILSAAAPLLRARGILAVTIDEMMAAADLTRGGFYAHFESKDALLAAVLDRETGLQALLRRARLGELPPRKTATALLSYYLHPRNREETSSDCPMSTMSADVRRSGGAAAAAMQRKFSELVFELGHLVRDPEDAQTLGASIIGATTLAGAMGPGAASTALLRSTARLVRAKLKPEAAKPRRPARRGAAPSG